MVQAIILSVSLMLALYYAVLRGTSLPDTTPHDIAVEEYEVALSDYNNAVNTYKQCGPEYTEAAIYDWRAASDRLRVALAKVKGDRL